MICPMIAEVALQEALVQSAFVKFWEGSHCLGCQRNERTCLEGVSINPSNRGDLLGNLRGDKAEFIPKTLNEGKAYARVLEVEGKR